MDEHPRRDAPPSVLLAAASDSMCCARIPGLLARAGWRVTVVAPSHSPALASRHVWRRLPVAASGDWAARQLRALHTSGDLRFDWTILGDEEMVASVAARVSEPWAAACLPVPALADAVELISRKTSFIAACQRDGIPTPPSRVCRSEADAIPASREIGFPLLLKADFGASGTTVWAIDDLAHLLRALPRAAGRPFTLQARIAGESGVTEMLCDRGRALAIVSSVMRDIDPEPFGPASSRLYRRNVGAEAIAVRIAALTGFHGFCGFDWVQSHGSEGPVHVLEFHARPTLGFHMAHRAGVDFALATRSLHDDRVGATFVQHADRETACLFFPKDLTRAWRRRDLRGLLRWIPGATINDLPWGDLPLARLMLQRFAERRVRRALEPRGAAPHTESPSVLTGL